MAEVHRTVCTCATCGATAEPLLRTTGAMARRLDTVSLGDADASGRIVKFGDLRRVGARLPWRPQITLIAGLAPAGLILMQKFAASALISIMDLDGQGVPAVQPMGQAAMRIAEALPYVASIGAGLALCTAAWQWWSNERYEERRQWLDAIADRIDTLRARAALVTACGYCNSLHVAGERHEATAGNLADTLGVSSSEEGFCNA